MKGIAVIPDTIEIDLASLKTPENVDRRAHIATLLRQILCSAEVTPCANEAGEWVLDFDWEPIFGAVTLKKLPPATFRQRVKAQG
jgi:hypothetical protein